METIPLFDRLILFFFPHFLYRTKWVQNIADLSASLLHLASPKDHAWKFMDYVTLKKGSIFRYRGTVKQLHMRGDLNPKNYIIEVITGISDRTVNPGDILMIEKKDLSSLVEAPRG